MKPSVIFAAAVTLFSVASFAQQREEPKLTLHVEADYLALHATGEAPVGSTAVQYRFSVADSIREDAAWVSGPPLSRDAGVFKLDLPLPKSRWAELQVRAMKGDEMLASKEVHAKQASFVMLTPARIAALPDSQQAAWNAFLKRSAERREAEFDLLAAECRGLGQPHSRPAPDNRAELELHSDTPSAWFGSAEAGRKADAIITYQTPSGGWSKAVDFTAGPRQPGMHWTSQTGEPWHYCGTIDNRTTTEQIKLLAGVYSATQREDAKKAALRGLDYLLEAQYPNGGWPQNYPVEPGYHEAITLNDNAMLHVLELMLAVVDGRPPFAFLDGEYKHRAQAAYDKGVHCLLACQVRIDGKPSVWCAQHDPLTLDPVGARKKEPPSLSGSESAELLKFFMRTAPLSPEVTAIIPSAIEWLDAHRVTGLRKTKNERGKTDYIGDPTSDEVYWARFYDVKTGRPMFAGAEDGIVYESFSEMAAKNHVGYDYFTTKPADLVGKELARWKKRLAKAK